MSELTGVIVGIIAYASFIRSLILFLWISVSHIPYLLLVSGFHVQRVDSIDPALRRSGRFDAEIEVTTPNEEERFQILKVRF